MREMVFVLLGRISAFELMMVKCLESLILTANQSLGCPTASIVPGRLRSQYAGHTIGLQRLSNWLEDCDNGHQCRPPGKLTRLPTRVLQVLAGSQLVKLYETNGKTGKYLALSHSWGKSHRITTTRANLESHKAGIRISDLPKTFQEALLLARHLEIPFVWIDSLCIIQDSAQDWEHEASMMGEVYANAYLTISASASADDSTGIFVPEEACSLNVSADSRAGGRACSPNVTPRIALKKNSNGGWSARFDCLNIWGMVDLSNGPRRGGRLYFTPEWMPSSIISQPERYLIGEFGTPYDPIAAEPLSKRGWTLQERLLSPRIIHYANQERCTGSAKSACWRKMVP
jgi:hypothetical protein